MATRGGKKIIIIISSYVLVHTDYVCKEKLYIIITDLEYVTTSQAPNMIKSMANIACLFITLLRMYIHM